MYILTFIFTLTFACALILAPSPACSVALLARTETFVVYPPNPSLTVSPIARHSNSFHEFQITKSQLEHVLGPALDAKLDLQVMSDEPDPVTGQHALLGRIPVHLRVNKLKIGGVSVSRLMTQSVNEKRDPVNFGNIWM
ncbi:hypothetical protein BG011_005628 [Mortierella polycephala]|uniref:Uncharacterized protein n=1 Tax=Mortierella polycephala TaxID=41804 RepID=A0A9P6PY69_9FUNG|nr:hypothetical protein BG011_005628 [Mortierella polycephala]